MIRKFEVLRIFNRPYFEISSEELKKEIVHAMFTIKCAQEDLPLPKPFDNANFDKKKVLEIAKDGMMSLIRELELRN
jgi:hypothetical protein